MPINIEHGEGRCMGKGELAARTPKDLGKEEQVNRFLDGTGSSSVGVHIRLSRWRRVGRLVRQRLGHMLALQPGCGRVHSGGERE